MVYKVLWDGNQALPANITFPIEHSRGSTEFPNQNLRLNQAD